MCVSREDSGGYIYRESSRGLYVSREYGEGCMFERAIGGCMCRVSSQVGCVYRRESSPSRFVVL
jgi:hypothetical protein